MARRGHGRLNGKRLGHWVCAVLAGVMGGVVAAAGIPCQYTLELVQHDCAWPFPDSVTEGTGIASDGTACGWWQDCVTTDGFAFTWPPGGGIETIPYPTGITHMQANDISSDGRLVVGEMEYDDFGGVRAFCRTEDGTILDLDLLPGGDLSRAHGVSITGTIVGECLGRGFLKAFRWDRGLMTDLMPLLGEPNGVAYGIADNGLITGWAGTSLISDAKAFILDGDQVTILPLPPEADRTEARAVTSAGNVCGRFMNATSSYAYGHLNGKPVALSQLPGTSSSQANDLNDECLVGSATVDGLGQRAMLWTYDGQVRDLNSMIAPDVNVTVKQAYAISDTGQIAATGLPLGPFDTGTVAVRLIPIWPRTGDLNCDQIVNGFDLALLLGEWGSCRTTSCSADLDKDGIVNGIDVATLLGLWG